MTAAPRQTASPESAAIWTSHHQGRRLSFNFPLSSAKLMPKQDGAGVKKNERLIGVMAARMMTTGI
jgi:hypothetical protein